MDRGLILFIFITAFVGIVIWYFERRRLSTKELAVIAVLAAIAALGRIPFVAIPSAQPTTFIVIITGFVFGCTFGFLVGLTAAVVSNMFLGQGPWTMVQVIAWGLCGISAGLLGKWVPKAGKLILIGFSFIWGYLYGWITNLWYWLAFVYPLTFSTWVYANVGSFWFDSIHAAMNSLFMLILGADFIRILKRFKEKLTYTKQQAVIN